MAGRGRGRMGRGRGISPAFAEYARPEDSLPPTGQPPPLYPDLQFKSVPLLTGKKWSYLVTLRESIRSSIRDSGYFIRPEPSKNDVERYTDKFRQLQQVSDEIEWDKSLFPRELFESPKKKKKKIVKKILVKEVVKTLEELEAKEQTVGNEEEEDEEEEAENEEEEYEDEEEDTDYAANYFDNGESYVEEEDAGDEPYE